MNLGYALVAALTTAPCPAPPPALREYSVDYGHTILEFAIRFAFTRVKGRFTEGQGTILYDAATPANSSISLVVQAKSIDTGWPHRDEHLRTSDFFDVATFPTITFQSRRVWRAGDGWMAEGDLTMHGVTRRITLPFAFTQPPIRSAESRWMVMTAAGGVKLARADFGITGGDRYNSWFTAARAATMGDSVDVSFELDAYSPDAASQRSPRIETELAKITREGIQAYVASLRELKKTKTSGEFAPWRLGADLVARGLIANCRLADAAILSGVLATELFPDSHSARLTHGFVLSLIGETRAAAAEFAKAKELFRPPPRAPDERFPQVDDTWWYADQLGRSALEWGYAPAAVPLARTLAEIYPTARAFTLYGMALASAGDTRGAAAAYDRAVALDAGEPRALEWRRRPADAGRSP